LDRQIKTRIHEDRRRRTEEAGEAIEAALKEDGFNQKKAYQILKAWYRHCGDRPPKPSRQDLESTAKEFQDLYKERDPVGEPIPCQVKPYKIPDHPPTEEEIAVAVARLKNNKATGPSKMKPEHFKEWYTEAYPPPPKEGQDPPTPFKDNWLALVGLVQHIFATGQIPTEASWGILAVIPKPQGGVRGIGILEALWKLIEAIIDTRIQSNIQFHDILHGFRKSRGTSTAIIEAKLHQELAHIKRKTLFQVFLDLKKAYDTLHRGRALDTLQAYGVGPNILRLIRRNWKAQKLVPRQSGFHGPVVTPGSGNTQGGIFSPVAFNIQVDNVVRHWLSLVLDDKGTVTDGLGFSVEQIMALFYADDGCLSTIDHEWLQKALEILTELFRRIGLETNTQKTVLMISNPPTMHANLSQQAYRRKLTGDGPTYKEWKRGLIQCPRCDTTLRRGSLVNHLRCQHGEEPEYDSTSTTLTSSATETATSATPYRISFPKGIRGVARPCPIPACYGRFKHPTGLRKHFMTHHPHDTVCILEEGGQPLPQCSKCNMHLPYSTLNGKRHENSRLCKQGAALKAHRLQEEKLRKDRDLDIQIGDSTLPKVTSFCYLGRVLAANSSDWPALYKNLKKAQAKWAMVHRPLIKTGVSPRHIGYFYKAIVQAILLYGSETWTITPRMLQILNGFHHRIARRISGLMPVRQDDDSWFYPPLEKALEIAGLYTIAEYIQQRQNTLASYVLERPILQLCQQYDQAPYTQSRMYRWWSQPKLTTDTDLPTPTTATQQLLPLSVEPKQPSSPVSDDDEDGSSMSVDGSEHSFITACGFINPASIPLSPAPLVQPSPPLPPSLHPPPTTATLSSHPYLPGLKSFPTFSPAFAQTVRTTSISSLTFSHTSRIRPIDPPEQIVLTAFFNQEPSNVRVSAPELPHVTIQSLHTLKPGRWLGDEVINGYLSLLIQREERFRPAQASTTRICHCFSTHFYAMLANLEDRTPSLRGYNYQRVRNWGRRNAPEADIFRLETLFIPININNCHWASAVIDFQAHTITFLDSLGDPGMPHLNRLLRYLQDEHRALYDQELAGWTLVPTPSSTPRQVNGFDCGVYTCLFANRTFQRATLHATPHDISTFREHIAYSIVSGAARLG
jgi:hypothetical protein